ncbi:MAG: hypothetical protein WC378_05580 [Opitutaceae bacterium]|jgi:hypothetical protein
MINRATNPHLTQAMQIGGLLYDLAEITIRQAQAKAKNPSIRRRKGCTLRPGPATPLWNELLRQAKPFLQKRGAKVELARILGIPRQRIHEYFRSGTAIPDAERCILLICWVSTRQQGKEFFSEPVGVAS